MELDLGITLKQSHREFKHYCKILWEKERHYSKGLATFKTNMEELPRLKKKYKLSDKQVMEVLRIYSEGA